MALVLPSSPFCLTSTGIAFRFEGQAKTSSVILIAVRLSHAYGERSKLIASNWLPASSFRNNPVRPFHM